MDISIYYQFPVRESKFPRVNPGRPCVSEEKRRNLKENHFFQEKLNAKLDFYMKENERLSKEACDATLRELYKDITAKMKTDYKCPGGYKKYHADLKEMTTKYYQKKSLGVMVMYLIAANAHSLTIPIEVHR